MKINFTSTTEFIHLIKLFLQAMAKDKKNIWQETPKQIRQKVLKFVSIPEHFAVYAKERGLLEDGAYNE